MGKSGSLLLVLLLTALISNGQYTRFVVQLKDKKGTTHSISNPSTYLSAKAIERRSKQKISIDSTDLPISAAYLDSIRSVPNVQILNRSKWLNQVLIRTSDPAALSKINSFPFVKTSAAVAAQANPLIESPIQQKFKEVLKPVPPAELISGAYGSKGNSGMDALNYGGSLNQIRLHEGEYLHNLGYTGAGITIAVLDAGFFGYKTNPAIDSLRLQGRILGEWDYVLNESSVTEDHPHGLYCLSIIGANRPGVVMGTAPHAKFYLFRTEDAATEYPVEEQNWVAAAEYADSAGVDMISSSLGYYDFDDPAFNHSYAQRDGNTSIITRGADFAAKKGIIVMNSAGNSGNSANESRFVACPADGDSVFAVGATNVTGTMASFSSWGPNGAGKVKPNIVSVGQGTVLANTAGNAVSGNGTSFSNPLACGLIACLWQAFPEFTNMEILKAVEKSSSRYSYPDERYGYGLPNFRLAYEILTRERQYKNINTILGDSWLKAFPNPFSQQQPVRVAFRAPADGVAVFQLVNSLGQLMDARSMSITANSPYLVEFTNTYKLQKGTYFVRYTDGKNKQTVKIVKQ